MDNKLFNKEDILTITTADQAVKGDRGYFGDNLTMLATNVKHGNIHSLAKIYESTLFPFKGDHHVDSFGLFLPVDKVKCKEIIYRPLRSIDELFDFMLPDCAGADYTTDEKVEKLLGQRYTIKNKIDGTLKQHIVSFLDTPVYGALLLNFVDLKFLFENFEFKKGDKFVPFGIEEE